jgi:hypothetical protein
MIGFITLHNGNKTGQSYDENFELNQIYCRPSYCYKDPFNFFELPHDAKKFPSPIGLYMVVEILDSPKERYFTEIYDDYNTNKIKVIQFITTEEIMNLADTYLNIIIKGENNPILERCGIKIH